MIELKLHNDAFKQIRFTISPCFELVMAFRSFLRSSNKGYFSNWIKKAEENILTTDFPYLSALVRKNGYIPDFLTPLNNSTILTVEIDNILMTKKNLVMKDIEKVSKHYGLEEAIYAQFTASHKSALKLITNEMTRFWGKTLLTYWGKCKSFLESDILYRSQLMAKKGVEAVFDNIGKGIEYKSSSLRIDKKFSALVKVNKLGLLLMPSVFSYPDVYVVYAPSQPVIIIYPIKDTRLFSDSKLTHPYSLQLLFGATSTIILELLDQPRTTYELSILTRITAGVYLSN